jgi:citrate lyase subunit beta / citryl-CoA lyase
MTRPPSGYTVTYWTSSPAGGPGKWVLHPTQFEAANQAFAPSAADYFPSRAHHRGLCSCHHGQARCAVMLGDEMIDEASRKMAEAIAARGNAAGLVP